MKRGKKDSFHAIRGEQIDRAVSLSESVSLCQSSISWLEDQIDRIFEELDDLGALEREALGFLEREARVDQLSYQMRVFLRKNQIEQKILDKLERQMYSLHQEIEGLNSAEEEGK